MMDYRTRFVERLSEHDFALLAEASDVDVGQVKAAIRDSADAIHDFLSRPELYEFVFGGEEPAVAPGLTPHLAFAVLVYKAARDLDSTSYVPEWVGAGERLPVFDAGTLSEFVDDVTRRYLLVDFLGSFLRVASGSAWVKTERGYRKRKYSEMDPVGLAEMVAELPDPQRAAGYRRLGEVALFLTGVFLDHTASHPLSATNQVRLARRSGVDEAELVGTDYFHFLERVGSAWYERAATIPHLPRHVKQPLEDLATNFTVARRFLNYLADRYLHRLDTGLMNPVV